MTEVAVLWEGYDFLNSWIPKRITLFGDDTGQPFRWVWGEDVGPVLPPTLKVMRVPERYDVVELPIREEPVVHTYDPAEPWWETITQRVEAVPLRLFVALTRSWRGILCYQRLWCGWAPQSKLWVVGRRNEQCREEGW